MKQTMPAGIAARALLSSMLAAACAAYPIAHAAPITYQLTTGPALPFGGTNVGNATNAAIATALAAQFSGSAVTGTFKYDAAAPLSAVNADGSYRYGNGANGTAGSFSALAVTVAGGAIGAGFGMSDPVGFTVVGNNTFQVPAACPGCPLPPKTDIFQLLAEPSVATVGTHNVAAFSIGGFTLFNVRMFWIEGQSVPEPIGGLFGNSNLPLAPPGMHGRLALDFVQTGNPSGPQFDVFFDSLAVTAVAAIPEPETYLMLLAGLGMLGLAGARRRLLR